MMIASCVCRRDNNPEARIQIITVSVKRCLTHRHHHSQQTDTIITTTHTTKRRLTHHPQSTERNDAWHITHSPHNETMLQLHTAQIKLWFCKQHDKAHTRSTPSVRSFTKTLKKTHSSNVDLIEQCLVLLKVDRRLLPLSTPLSLSLSSSRWPMVWCP